MKLKKLTMCEQSGQGQPETEHIGDMVDHISNLPDCILHHILSFRPTKEVVKTSILSTRWKNLWVSVPSLDFDDELPCGRGINGQYWFEDSFINFLERVLHSRTASNLEKLRLRFIGSSYNKSEIYSCISSAIMHNVRELDLFLYARDPSVIPRSLFENTSLVILKIGTYLVDEIPSHVDIKERSYKNVVQGFLHFMPLGEKNSVWSSIPPCIKSCLKRVTLKNFHGYNSELCFLKCVLKHACALERIDVRWSETFLRDLEKKTKVRKELEKTERRSTACVINFS